MLYDRLLILPLFVCAWLGYEACTGTPQRAGQQLEPEPVIRADFADPEPEQIWLETSLKPDASIDTVRDFPGGKYVLAGEKVLKGPVFEVSELTYYQLDFQATTTHKAMWAMVFWDASGKMLLADIYSSIDPTGNPLNHRFFFQAKADAVQAQFWFRLMNADAEAQLTRMAIRPVQDNAHITNWLDSVSATIPAIGPITVPEDRKTAIPRTVAALEKGKQIRIVMLGNSIINDTGNSGWETLVEAAYPGSDVEVITSVRGGTGCWYYQENNRIDTFVVRYDPDLLIIGGISHKKDTAAIHQVIRQVRAKIDPEILVFSGPVGRQGDPRTDSTFTIPPTGDDFRLQLQKLSQDAGVGYFDMKTEWGKYIQSSGKDYDFFLRDPVHANARGRQVLARLMYAYFAP